MQGGPIHVWVYYPCSSRSWCISTITALRRRISCGVPRAPHSACTRVLALAHLSRPRTAHLGSHPARWGPWGQAGTILTPGWAASWPLSPIDLRVLSRVNVDGTKGTAGRGRPRKARLVVQRAGAPHEGQEPRRVCLQRPPGPRAVLCRVRTCTCRVTQHACCTQNLHGARKFLARSSADSTRMHGRLSRSVRKTASRGLARRPLVRAPGGSSARALSDPHSPQGPPHGQHPLGGSLPRVTSPETVDRGPR